MAASNPYLQVEGLTCHVGDKTLFADLSLGVAQGQRIGLIAKNGTGKTSLLDIIAGRRQADEGTITWRRDLRVAYLEQTPQFPQDMTVMEACLWMCDEEPLRIKEYLTKLDIRHHDQLVSQLSGGQLKRVALANVLCRQPDFLILDEPTNHLDLTMIEWLENYLNRSSVTLLMVTHDRYFLDRVCNIILELDGGQLYTYRGNYAYYLEKRQERIDNANAEIARANNLYRRELDWMRRMPQARATKANYRKDAFYELEEKARRDISEPTVSLQLNASYIGSKIFEAAYVSKAFPASADGEKPKVILKDFYYNFSRYEKMGIVGANGTGKSTFVKMLLGEVRPDSGRFVIGETVRFGYYSQEGMKFDNQMRVIDAVRRVAEYVDLGGGRHLTAMQFLQHFLFTPLQQQNYIYKLSGGERRRLYLCTVLMQNPNFLILDEPTNDLDIVTLQILEEYLRTFKGCVIVVSHDRYFMDKVVDHLLVFQGDGVVKDFPGNYTQFRQWEREQTAAAAKEPVAKPKSEAAPRNATARKGGGEDTRPRRLSFKERRELEALEADIERLETEKADIEAALCSGTLDVEQLTRLSIRLPQLKDELDAKEMRWLELSEAGG